MSDGIATQDAVYQVNRNVIALANALDNLDAHVQGVEKEVEFVGFKVDTVENNLQQLINEFLDYVKVSEGRFNVTDAKQNLIQINQELDRLFGHYEEIRRMTTGILQATDVGIIRRETMVSLTEEVTVKAPGYWLAPALLALTAWINDDRSTAEKAVKEAMGRDYEKTCLLFALICRRAGRLPSSLKWLRKFMECQDPDNMSQKAIVMLDAYVSGLLGLDSEGEVSSKLSEWLDHIVNSTNFDQKQIDKWDAAIENLISNIDTSDWKYLPDNSPDWPQILKTLNYVELHQYLYDYFMSVFDVNANNDPLKVQLDEELNDLVTNYDEEEIPLRVQKRYNELVVECNGDKDLANKQMDVEKESYEEHVDFASILSEASMNPEVRGISPGLQKYSIAMCKDWILGAYRDVIAKYEAQIPNDIHLEMTVNVDGHPHKFADSTVDGSNEVTVIGNFTTFMSGVREHELALNPHTAGEMVMLILGLILAVAGGVMIPLINPLIGIVLIAVGLFVAYKGYKKRKAVESRRQNVMAQCDNLVMNGPVLIRAIFAEVVDFRRIVKKKDAKSADVEEFLSGLDVSHYLVKRSDGTRSIKFDAEGSI